MLLQSGMPPTQDWPALSIRESGLIAVSVDRDAGPHRRVRNLSGGTKYRMVGP
jgi:hypothetical protein